MPRIQEICSDLAERFVFEPAKVLGYARALREAGLLSTGARGRHAPNATALDVVRLMIPMMLRVKIDDAVDAVEVFGRGVPANDEPVNIAGKKVKTFEDAFALLLEYCMQPYDGSQNCEDRFYSYDFGAMIIRGLCQGRIELTHIVDGDDEPDEVRQFTFIHPDLEGIDPLASNTGSADKFFSDRLKYRSGFHEVPNIGKSEFISLGQVLAGHKPLGWICRGWTFEDE